MIRYSLLFELDEDEQGPLLAELYEFEVAGIIERSDRVEVFFDATHDVRALAGRFRRWSPRLVTHDDRDWVAETERSFPAQLVGRRFFLVPPWNEDATPTGRFRLQLNPGRACGTGWHPCTRLCLQALELAIWPGCRVLDVGTGSGILSRASQLLGAGAVCACDVDPEAVFVAKADFPGIHFFIGSADSVCDPSFDVVVANISAAAALSLFSDFARIAPVRILSGFEDLPPFPVAPSEVLEQEGWRCAVFRGRLPSPIPR